MSVEKLASDDTMAALSAALLPFRRSGDGAIAAPAEAAPGQGVLLADEAGRVVALDDAAARLLGVTAAAAQGRNLQSLLPAGIRATRHPLSFGPDMREVVVLQREAWQVPDAESLLLQIVADALPVPIAVSSAIDHRLIFANSMWAERTGVRVQDWLGRSVEAFYGDPADRHRLVAELRREGTVESFDVAHRSSTGRVYATGMSAALAQFRGEPVVIAVLVDLGGRKVVEEELRRSRNTLRDAIESLNDGFILYDVHGRVLIHNRRFLEFYPALAEVGLIGLRYEELLRLFLEHDPAFAQALDDPEDWIRQKLERQRLGDGETVELPLSDGRWVMVQQTRTHEGGVVSLTADITQRKLGDAALQQNLDRFAELAAENMRAKEVAESASRTKSNFLAAMSHELRTPLNAILGFSDLMQGEVLGPLSEHYRQYAHDIHGSGLHLLDVINDLLDMAKIEAGRRELNIDWIDFRDVADGALAIVGRLAADKGVELTGPARLGPVLQADGRALRQVLINLLGNAVKFTPRGGRVRLDWHDEAGMLRVRVVDTGIGIEAEDLGRLGRPFERGRSPMLSSGEGTGLGLALSRALVEHHGGRLQIDSVPGGGTTVCFELPLVVDTGRPRPFGRPAG